MSTKKEQVTEIFIIRAIACLAIVLLHSVTSSLSKFSNLDSTSQDILVGLQMILIFGTPVFVFISEFLLSKSYPKHLPKGFFIKRFKFLLLPYLSMAVIYGIIDAGSLSLNALIIEILRNIILADYVGYFIIIIFQFYFLHLFFQKYFYRWKAKYVLPITFIINGAFLAFFNFVPPMEFIPHSEYVWTRLSWMPFVGWIFYFSLGYYSGKNIQYFKSFIQKYKIYLFIGTFISIIVVLTSQFLGLPNLVSSKRVDILIFTTLLVLSLFYLSSKIKKVPSVIFLISNYSFNIYLLHKIFMTYLERLPINNIAIYILLLFLISLGASISLAKIINKLPFGKYIVGNTATFKSPDKEHKYVRKAV
ncbi:acyltransferase family protein [Peribacillus sp. YIM B13472]|uniref:acyltransferase family protein n=1 Tax=Peribacillus sp. YIM B13472 TaxID=3366297 RepID=UPI0036719002